MNIVNNVYQFFFSELKFYIQGKNIEKVYNNDLSDL